MDTGITFFTVFIVVSLLFGSVFGRYFERDFDLKYGSTKPKCNEFISSGFGFHRKGSLSVEIECSLDSVAAPRPPDLFLLVCTPLEEQDSSKNLPECGKHADELCSDFQDSSDPFPYSSNCGGFKLNCLSKSTKTNVCNEWSTDAVIPDDYYEFFFLQCPSKKLLPLNASDSSANGYCKGNLTLLNDNGRKQLGRGEEPLLYIYKGFVILWTALLALWIFNWVQYHQYSNPLHKILVISPLCKYVVLCLSIARWEIVDKTGVENDTLLTTITIFQSAEDAMLFMALMLAAEGWCVMRPHIRKVKHALLPVLFLAFLASVICVTLVRTYFMAFAVCSIVFVIYRALKWCSFNLELLNKQLIMMHTMIVQKDIKFRGVVGFEEQLLRKRDIYTKLRMVISMYTMVFAIITTMSNFLQEYEYVRILSFEVPELLVYLSLGHIFKLEDFSAYENIEVDIPKENSVIVFLPYPDINWPKRQKIVLGYPLENSVVEVVDEKKALLIDR